MDIRRTARKQLPKLKILTNTKSMNRSGGANLTAQTAQGKMTGRDCPSMLNQCSNPNAAHGASTLSVHMC